MSMNKTQPKGLAILLTICMMLAMMPMAVFADTLEYATLETAILDAANAKANVAISTDGTDVLVGTDWVTQTDLDTLVAAIEVAQQMIDHKSANNQEEVDNAVTVLETAIDSFNDAKAAGTKVEFIADYSSLAGAILDATNAKANVAISTDGTDVLVGTDWVTQTDLDTLVAAIEVAQQMIDHKSANNQEEVDNAVTVLETAIDSFNDAKAEGTKTSLYTIVSIDSESAGGAGITRTITTNGTNGTNGHQYLVVQMIEGTGINAHVSVIMVKAEASVTVSYKTTAIVQAWLTDGMPNLSGSGATDVTIYDTKASN